MRYLLFILALGAVGLAGCAGRQDLRPAGARGGAEPPTPQAQKGTDLVPHPVLAGKVAKVNSAARFVVINFPIGRLPEPGQVFDVYHGTLKTGEVRISGPHLDDNIVADVILGGVEPGDDVRTP